MTTPAGSSDRRTRVRRSLTFWLRPAFVLRVVHRFQKLVGFDRAMALASSALTALIPLALLIASVLSRLSAQDLAERIIQRYRLSGGGADAVRHLFAFAGEADAGFGFLGAAFLIVSSLSLARAAQRLVEQTWQLPPLSVRNTVNGLLWLLVLVAYAAATGTIHAALGDGRIDFAASLAEIPVTALFLIWGGWLLSAKRLARRTLTPFGVIGAILIAAYVMAAAIYLPRLFDSSATRYGPIGAVFAMITALFGTMLVLVASSALGREVADELDRIRRGLRPPDDEVRHQWANVLDHARERWRTARKARRRRGSAGSNG
jgi:membrane protein